MGIWGGLALAQERLFLVRFLHLVDGDWVFVSGTTGFDYQMMTISEDVVEQTEQCFQNTSAALHEAGCTLQDVVRVRYILPDR